jgi:hypothetical protein
MRFARVLLLLFTVPTSAEASLVTVDFAGTIMHGALTGTPLGGSFTYDDPYDGVLCLACQTTTSVPMLQLSLFVGSHNFGLSDALPGAIVVTPLGGWWGPGVKINPLALSALGLSSLTLSPHGMILLAYTYADGFLGINHVPITTIRSVPESTPALLLLAGIALLATRHLKHPLTQGRLHR